MMKHGPMEWQFGDEEVVTEPPKTNNNSQPVDRKPSRSRRPTWLVIFAVALVASWTTGFYLGRVQQSTAALEVEIQGRLDVESWAWQQGDWDLFRSLLPPHTPSWNLMPLRTAFMAAAPKARDMKLIHYLVSENGSQIEVTVQVSKDGRQYEIGRTYRLMDGRWWLVRLGEFDGALILQ
jgi:hypothetical protein